MTAHLTPADRDLLHRLRSLPGGVVLAEEVRDLIEQRDDGSITLPPNPFGSSATWADFDWRGMADNARTDEGWVSVAGKVFDLIAAVVEADEAVVRVGESR